MLRLLTRTKAKQSKAFKSVSEQFLRPYSTKGVQPLSVSGLQTAKVDKPFQSLFSEDYLRFLRALACEFIPRRQQLMQQRAVWQRMVDAGKPLTRRDDTKWIRDGDWKAPQLPSDLARRWVEITGPAGNPSMVINALNSGANCYMADLEDSQSPNWLGILAGHLNMNHAVRGTLRHEKKGPDGKVEKAYELNDETAFLHVRARGLHMVEANVIDESGRPMPATVFDIATYLYNNAAELISQGKTVSLYMPKLQTFEEACYVHDLIKRCEECLGIPYGSVKVTSLIETLPGLLETDEIIFGLGPYAAGLNCGRWDHIFSVIKTQAADPSRVLPDRSLLTMDVPFLTNYMDQIVQSCHRRGVHAMGGMSAFIPTKDADETAKVMEKVKRDKQLELEHGCDGAWVAHPGMVAPIQAVFEAGLKGRDNQIDSFTSRAEVISTTAFLDVPEKMKAPQYFTEQGLRENIKVAIQYEAAWYAGVGAVALNNLMEDKATAEISRSQVWAWLHNQVKMTFADGKVARLTEQRFNKIFKEVVEDLMNNNQIPYAKNFIPTAAQDFQRLVRAEKFEPFIQDVTYQRLLNSDDKPRPANQRFVGQDMDAEEIKALRGSRPDLEHDPVKLTKHRGEYLNTVLQSPRQDGLAAHYSFLGTASGTSAINVVAGGRGLVGPYSGGWQANAMRNRLQQSLPDTLWVSPEEPGALGHEFNNFLFNADKVQMLAYLEACKKLDSLPEQERAEKRAELDAHLVDYFASAVLADLEQGWSDPKKARLAVHYCIKNGINVMHIEDQGPAKRCGHLGGKELRPLDSWLQIMKAANFAAIELLGPEQVSQQWVRFVARTDALSAERIRYSKKLEDPSHPDHPFIDWSAGPNEDGFTEDGEYVYLKKGTNPETGNPYGLDHSVVRTAAVVEAGLASHVWMETPDANLADAKKFLDGVNALLAPKGIRAQGLYNHSPSFVWDLTFYIEAQEFAKKVAEYVSENLIGMDRYEAQHHLRQFMATHGDLWRGDQIFTEEHIVQIIKNGRDLANGEQHWREAIQKQIDAVRSINKSLPAYKVEQELRRIEKLGYRPLRHITNIIVAQRLYNFRQILADSGFNLHLVTLPQFHLEAYRMHELADGMAEHGIHDYVKHVQRAERKHQEDTGNTYTYYGHQKATGTALEARFFGAIGSHDTNLLTGSTEAADQAKKAELEARQEADRATLDDILEPRNGGH